MVSDFFSIKGFLDYPDVAEIDKKKVKAQWLAEQESLCKQLDESYSSTKSWGTNGNSVYNESDYSHFMARNDTQKGNTIAWLNRGELKGAIIFADAVILRVVMLANDQTITRFNTIYLAVVLFLVLQAFCFIEMSLTYWFLPFKRILETRQVILIETVL